MAWHLGFEAKVQAARYSGRFTSSYTPSLPLDQTITSTLNDTIWPFLSTRYRTLEPDVRYRP